MAFDTPISTWRLPNYQWPLPESIRQRLSENSIGRQRLIAEEGHLLLVLHQPPAANQRSREGILILRLPDGRWMADGQDNGELAFNRLFDAYETILGQLVDEQREADQARELLALLRRLVPLSRAASNLREVLQQAREAARSDRKLIGFRDRAYDLARTLEILSEEVRFTLDTVQAEKAEEEVIESRAARINQLKLNLLAATTFPLMALGSIFGMNVASGVSDSSIIAFWLILAAGMVMGYFLARWVR